MKNERGETSRRDFMCRALLGAGATAGALTGGAAEAAEPIKRNGHSYMKLSLAGYSFNRLLARRGTPEEIAKAPMRLEDFVAYCAELNLDGCEPTAYYFPKTVTHDYLMNLKEMTFRLGLDISSTAIGNNFCLPKGKGLEEQLAYTKEWIDHAAELGAPVIRIFAGRPPAGEKEDAVLERVIESIDTSLDYAAERGVFLAIENHGPLSSQPEAMMRIIEGVKSSAWFGVNFDSGNFHSADPYADMAKIAPYAVTAQIKVFVNPHGIPQPADFKRIIGILRDADYRGYIVLEYEDKIDPKKAIPGHIKKLREAIRA